VSIRQISKDLTTTSSQLLRQKIQTLLEETNNKNILEALEARKITIDVSQSITSFMQNSILVMEKDSYSFYSKKILFLNETFFKLLHIHEK